LKEHACWHHLDVGVRPPFEYEVLMPIDSPAGPLQTLEEAIDGARSLGAALELHEKSPVLLVVAPLEAWAADVTAVRADQKNITVTMLPTMVMRLEENASEVTFGRSAQNDVVMPFAALSKQHGFFRRTATGWAVADVGSRNGTYVDGSRVGNGVVQPLRDGATLRFGDVTARFMLPQSFCIDLRRRLSEP
jgi:hypothetical protein